MQLPALLTDSITQCSLLSLHRGSMHCSRGMLATPTNTSLHDDGDRWWGGTQLSNNAEQGLDSDSCAGVEGGRSLGFARVWGRTPEKPSRAARGMQVPARQKVATPEYPPRTRQFAKKDSLCTKRDKGPDALLPSSAEVSDSLRGLTVMQDSTLSIPLAQRC